MASIHPFGHVAPRVARLARIVHAFFWGEAERQRRSLSRAWGCAEALPQVRINNTSNAVCVLYPEIACRDLHVATLRIIRSDVSPIRGRTAFTTALIAPSI